MANIPVIMRILQLHCDNISYEATKKEIKSEVAADLKVVAVVVGAAELKDPKYEYCSFHFCISNRKEKSSPTYRTL